MCKRLLLLLITHNAQYKTKVSFTFKHLISTDQHLVVHFQQVFKSSMMSRLAIVFVTVLVAVVAASPNNLLTSLKSLQHLKRAATLLKPLQPIQKQEKRMTKADFDMVLMMIDTDHDGMLNADELKSLLMMSGAPPSEIDTFVTAMMMFDKDKNQKLDFTEMEEASKMTGF